MLVEFVFRMKKGGKVFMFFEYCYFDICILGDFICVRILMNCLVLF